MATLQHTVSQGNAGWTTSANIYYNEGPEVTVKITYNSMSSGWRIRGKNPDTTVYLEGSGGTWSGTFDAEDGKTYYFQAIDKSTGYFTSGQSFTINFGGDDSGGDSGGDSGSISGGNHNYGELYGYLTLIIDQAEGTILDVNRTWKEGHAVSPPEQLINGDKVEIRHDAFQIKASADVGYKIDTYTVNGRTHNFYYSSFEWQSETATGYHSFIIPKTATENPVVKTTATLIPYTLTVPKVNNVKLTVKRISSRNPNASINKPLLTGDTIYYHDVLVIMCELDTGYELTKLAAGEQSIGNGDVYTVTGDTQISAVVDVISKSLTLIPDIKSVITVNRIHSPLKNAETGMIARATNSEEVTVPIYYSDELQISFSASEGYKILTKLLNQSPCESDVVYVVTDSDVEVVALTELSGTVYIYNGSNFDNYIVYIYNGSTWDQYIPYVYDGTKWCICS